MCIPSSSSVRRPSMILLWAALLSLGATQGRLLHAAAPAEKPQPAGAAEKKAPLYPHVTVSTWYEVDPKWPQRPEHVLWGQTPGVYVDGQDRVWVFTRAVPPVQVYGTDGKLLQTWGQEIFGDAAKTMISHHIKVDSRGRVWLADVGNHVVWQFSPEGKLLKVLGTIGEAGCDEKHLNKPTDMAFTPAGDVFVSDGYGNARVVHYNAEGKFVQAWGKLGSAVGEFSIPHAIVRDSQGRLYVADRNNVRVQVFDAQGQFLAQWQNLIVPWGLWITPQDEVWICGCSPMEWRETDDCLSCPPKDQIFMKFDTTGKALQLWTIPKALDGQEKPGQLNWVHGIAVDSRGNIYATDIIGKRAQKFVRH